MKNIIKTLILFLLFISFISILPRKVIYAAKPGNVNGTAKVKLPDNTLIVLPGVKLSRTDWWGFGYCQSGRCWGTKDTVETTTNSTGYYFMGNDMPEPNYVKRCDNATPFIVGGAHVCLTGERGKLPLSDDGRSCYGYNWCGFNCGSNPHKLEPYFPAGYHLPGNLEELGYSISGGHWDPLVIQDSWANLETKNDRNFIFVLNAPSPTSTPTATSTPIPPTVTNTPGPTSSPTPRATNTPTPTKVQCGEPCLNLVDCPLNCPFCEGPPGGKICVGPSVTPTPTKVPCGERCINPVECEERCPYCEGPAGNKVCVGPSATPTPTPTLVPCQCNKIEYTGTFGEGNTVTFITTATVENPDSLHTTKVLDVDYYLYQTDSSGTTTTGPVKVPAVFKETLTVNVIPVDYYTASWNYTFPTGLSGIVYFKVIAEIHCGYRSAGITYPQNLSVMVLAASTNTAGNGGMLNSILNFFQTLLGRNPTLRPQSVPPPAPTATPTPMVTVTPTINRSLQLATFGPWGLISQSCTGLEFWINYGW